MFRKVSLRTTRLFAALALIILCSCTHRKKNETTVFAPVSLSQDTLPGPYESKSVQNYSTVIGWTESKKPIAPPGFVVSRFADSLENPRWLYVTPNGDVLVAEANAELKGIKKIASYISGKAKSQNIGKSANRITLLRDHDKDGTPEIRQVLLDSLHQPFGMLVLGNTLYVANTDGIFIYPYQPGQTEIKSEGKKILDLPAGGYNNHWTRNIIANKDKTKIFIAVGSGSNIAENGLAEEILRANILEINPDGTGERVYASGLRNPVGMALSPETKQLWTVVNERDELGDDLVPDFLTSVKQGGFYGWPYAYFGKHEDPHFKGERPELVEQTLTPDVALGAHTSSLGLTFYSNDHFPAKYRNGVFIGQHGSWNRSVLSGYKVVFIPFKNGRPSGKPEDFLTGFVANVENCEVYGRPAGLAVLPDGALLVADDASNIIWKVELVRK